ncbi:hypothetical protein MTO98_26775 [Mucilaginibacter sp. SMC90]|uniref:hypothetical protein n=1 Tax=Mucilaginibacter sp. SMC90 TaxID=2929803 RepID=UPI001FB45DF5|nr:hypothetical protein [Mucilaginibacter sp. SMC90]UOE48020.1 hypothetical protein MTO98_26775 [Mucilaginibacter sp. SMC90]
MKKLIKEITTIPQALKRNQFTAIQTIISVVVLATIIFGSLALFEPQLLTNH